MRAIECFEATSAGVVIEGEVAVLSFLTNEIQGDRDASIVLSLDVLESLSASLASARRQHIRQVKALARSNPGPVHEPEMYGIVRKAS